MRSRLGTSLIVVACVLAAAGLACGSGGGSSKITNATLTKVCRGEGVEGAAYYGSAADGEGPFPVFVFRQANPDDAWFMVGKHELGEEVPEEWISTDGTETELVVCLSAVERELVIKCPYTKKDDKGGKIELVIELYHTRYEAVLRSARTAEIYDSATFVSSTDGKCDKQAVEMIDQTVRRLDAEPGAGLVTFIEPWVVK